MSKSKAGKSRKTIRKKSREAAERKGPTEGAEGAEPPAAPEADPAEEDSEAGDAAGSAEEADPEDAEEPLPPPEPVEPVNPAVPPGTAGPEARAEPAETPAPAGALEAEKGGDPLKAAEPARTEEAGAAGASRARLCELFAALSNPVALEVLAALAEKDSSVDDLSRATGESPFLLAMYLSDFRRRGIAEKDERANPPAFRVCDPDLKAILRAAMGGAGPRPA
jgi:DNA-binding transcriptional ArsR family regulator